MFKRATRLAKQILKKHPTWSWTRAVSEAFKKLRRGRK